MGIDLDKKIRQYQLLKQVKELADTDSEFAEIARELFSSNGNSAVPSRASQPLIRREEGENYEPLEISFHHGE